MNDKQRRAMMKYWWPQACKSQSWRSNDRELRLRVLSLGVTFTFTDQQEFREALTSYEQLRALPPGGVRFRHLESASDLNDTSDIDAVKALLLLLGDNLAGADEHGKPERGQGRRYMSVLDEKILCLSQYPLDKPMGMEGARAFVQEILNDKFNRGQTRITLALEDVDDRPRFVRNTSTGKLDEKPSQKEQLLMTVNGRLNGKTGFRNQANHSIHDMLTGVGLPCACSRCLRAANIASLSPAERAQLGLPPIEPPANDQDPELEPAAVADPELGSAINGDGDTEVPF